MSDTSPQNDAWTSKKINSRSPTKYKPLEMCDESVYDLARHYYTIIEISERFKVTPATLLELHGDAFQQGKDEAFTKPRMLLAKVMQDFSDASINFARMDVPTGTLLKAIELHAKKYEGLGAKTEVVHTGNLSYDAVESQPLIIEKPGE